MANTYVSTAEVHPPLSLSFSEILSLYISVSLHLSDIYIYTRFYISIYLYIYILPQGHILCLPLSVYSGKAKRREIIIEGPEARDKEEEVERIYTYTLSLYVLSLSLSNKVSPQTHSVPLYMCCACLNGLKMKYTQVFKRRIRICPTFCVTDQTKRLVMSTSDCLTKRLDVNQAIASLASDCFGVVCYYDVTIMLYDAVIYSMMP